MNHPNEISKLIYDKLNSNLEILIGNYESSGPINYFYIDDLLPYELALKIRASFPDTRGLRIKKSLRELKYIGAQMNEYDPLIERALYAFQDPEVVKIIEKITGIDDLEPDDALYAGGISIMSRDHFLNPHLDNSHNMELNKYRVLNLLYYVSPGWDLNSGGNLELWPNGPEAAAVTVESKFNRLVVMLTSKESWHSVSKVKSSDLRCCISNYYFRSKSLDYDYFHITSFRGRPEQKLRDFILKADIKLRMLIRKFFKKGLIKNSHFYKKNEK